MYFGVSTYLAALDGVGLGNQIVRLRATLNGDGWCTHMVGLDMCYEGKENGGMIEMSYNEL